MNLYAHDLSLFDFTNFSDDPIIDLQSSFGSLIIPLSDSNDGDHGDGGNKRSESPPKHRHDRTSPLPLGMDWSLPPPDGMGGTPFGLTTLRQGGVTVL
ncbi:hypothetical protein V6N13_023983 [Hibiscus sabdariffa]|uniref:Uncharacterized protein n=1 Tax=Hibiscus sabdariffa TaxID=183260 RepID=A0ABR2PND4_9ROSI